MKIIFFSYYFPPDLSPGSFRLFELIKILSKKIDNNKLIIITTFPNRYKTFKPNTNDFLSKKNIIIKRIKIPFRSSSLILQILSYFVFLIKALRISIKEKPDIFFGTSGRLMTLILTYISAKILNKNFIIDYRDIFSLSVRDLLFKNQILKYFFFKIFSKIENLILSRAIMVNVVADSFKIIFKERGLNINNWTSYTNGIDKLFLENLDNYNKKNLVQNKIKKILYVGNIGYAQGLKDFLPKIALKLDNKVNFTIIGDGNEKESLKRKINKLRIKNIKIIEPIPRNELLKYYKETDYLFLQLKNLRVFQTSLPSKIFEYATICKPIIAGLNGFAADFIKQNISHSVIYEPENIDDFVIKIKEIKNIKFDIEKQNLFIKNYSRQKIMNDYSDKLIENFKSNNLL